VRVTESQFTRLVELCPENEKLATGRKLDGPPSGTTPDVPVCK
jgi:hypothetical protein